MTTATNDGHVIWIENIHNKDSNLLDQNSNIFESTVYSSLNTYK